MANNKKNNVIDAQNQISSENFSPKKIMLANIPLLGYGYYLLKEYTRLGVSWIVFMIIILLFWSLHWWCLGLLLALFYVWVCYDCYDLVQKINSGEHKHETQEDIVMTIAVGILVLVVFLVLWFLLRIWNDLKFVMF